MQIQHFYTFANCVSSATEIAVLVFQTQRIQTGDALRLQV